MTPEYTDDGKGLNLDRAALSQQVKATWLQLRRRPVALMAGCGCAGGFGGLTTRDFEEALVFHIRERWRQDPAARGLEALDAIDDMIEWAGSTTPAPAGDARLAILNELKRSIDSFAFTCATHRFSAEAI